MCIISQRPFIGQCVYLENSELLTKLKGNKSQISVKEIRKNKIICLFLKSVWLSVLNLNLLFQVKF